MTDWQALCEQFYSSKKANKKQDKSSSIPSQLLTVEPNHLSSRSYPTQSASLVASQAATSSSPTKKRKHGSKTKNKIQSLPTLNEHSVCIVPAATTAISTGAGNAMAIPLTFPTHTSTAPTVTVAFNSSHKKRGANGKTTIATSNLENLRGNKKIKTVSDIKITSKFIQENTVACDLGTLSSEGNLDISTSTIFNKKDADFDFDAKEDDNDEEERRDAKNQRAQKILQTIRRASTNKTNEEGKNQIQKEFLLSQSQLSAKACDALRQNLGIDVSPENVPAPVESSEDPMLPKLFSTFMNRSKLAKPSAIQAQAWTAILSGKNVIAIGATGSGKTIAYLLPMVPHILANRQHGFVTALVLVPTRELAIQVSTVARSFRSLFGVSCYTVYGGADKTEQEEYLAQVGSVDLLVATPGRLCDLLENAKLSLGHVSYLVLDEADKMLEGSLGEQVSGLVEQCRGSAQRLVFSATLPEHILETVNALVYPSCIQVKVQESEGTTSLGAHIKQTVHVTSDAQHKKLRKLLRTLIQINTEHSSANPQVARNQRPSVMIFVNKIKTISSVVGCLQKATRVVGTSRGLSGNMRQAEREEVINGFRAGKFNNLVTTDLAGRGMDIKRLNHVINFDFPSTIPQYIHRVGRAGRQGQPSTTFTFFTRNRKGIAPQVLHILRQTKQWEDPNLLLLCDGVRANGDEAIEGDDSDPMESSESTQAQLADQENCGEKKPTPGRAAKSKSKTKSVQKGGRDPHGIPAWLLRNRTIVSDSDDD